MFRLFRALFNIFRRSPAPSSTLALPTAKPSDHPPSGLPDAPLSESPMPLTTASDDLDPTAPEARSGADSLRSARQSKLQNLKQVLNVLRAYTVTFGRPDTALDLRAVVGAIVANLTTVSVENSQLERFIDEAIAAFDSLSQDANLVDVAAQLLAEQVFVWLREQENAVEQVASAYLQQFAPTDAAWKSNQILALLQTIIATLNDGSLSQSGGRSLINRVLAAFNLDQALSRWVAPEWIALAQQVASYVDNSDLQVEIQAIAWSYIQQFQAILSPQLIEQIIETGPLNLAPADVLADDLDEFSSMLYYKLQLLESDPVVTKSQAAIAADIHEAAANFKHRRPPIGDVTTGVKPNDLTISSPFTNPQPNP